MTYQTFRYLVTIAEDEINVEDFVDIEARKTLQALKLDPIPIWAYAHEGFDGLRKHLGLSRPKVRALIGIPVRTQESWAAEVRSPAQHIVDLAAFALIQA